MKTAPDGEGDTGGTVATDVPHLPQNRSLPVSGVPHSVQNLCRGIMNILIFLRFPDNYYLFHQTRDLFVLGCQEPG